MPREKQHREAERGHARSGAAMFLYIVVVLGAFLFAAGGVIIGVQYGRSGSSSLLGNVSSLFGTTFGLSRTPAFEAALTDASGSLVRGEGGAGAAQGNGSPLIVRVCVRGATTSIVRDRVILSEIAWMGGAENSQYEWMELLNTSKEPADISGWQILDADEQIHITFEAGTILSPGGTLLLERNDAAVAAPADVIYQGNLRNTDESLSLFDTDCELVDEVSAAPSWPAGDNATKQTMERSMADLSWHTSLNPGGTPRAPNSKPLSKLNFDSPVSSSTATSSFVFASSTGGTVSPVVNPSSTLGASAVEPLPCAQDNLGAPSYAALINEVAWAGTGNLKTSDEWIELRNPSPTAPLALAGWRILNKARTLQIVFGASDTLVPNGYFLLERTDDAAVPTIPADKLFTGAIKNNDESLRLFDASCRLVDEIVAGASWPAGTASPEYRTAERSSDRSWHTYAYMPGGIIFGTPRALNSEPVAQPVSYVPSAPPADTGGGATPPAATSGTARVLISEVMAAGVDNVNYEFVELYNAGTASQDLTGWNVKRKASSVSEPDSFVVASHFSGKSIQAGGYFLLADIEGYTGSVSPDIQWPKSSLLADDDVLLLYDASGTAVDTVAWVEIPAGKSYTRTSWEGNNFAITDIPTPQNSQ